MDAERRGIEVADFAANYTKMLDDLDSGAVPGIDLTKDGKLVAHLRPASKVASMPHSLHGYLRGTVEVPKNLDLLAPVFNDPIHAETGREHE